VVVDHLTNLPLNHVLVQIIRTGKGGGDASVLTEADGRFTFLHVPKGKYRLEALKRGQAAQGFHANGGYTTLIVVDGIQKTEGIVFALRANAYINGTVTDENGELVRGAQIELFKEDASSGEIQTTQIKFAMTKSSGQFHFGDLAAGNYYIAAHGTPWYSQIGGPAQTSASDTIYPITFYGDTTVASAAQVIALPEGGNANIQINLHSVPSIRVKLAEPRNNFMLFAPGPGGSQIRVPVAFVSDNNNGNSRTMVRGSSGQVTLPAQMKNAENSNMEIANLAAGRYQLVSFDQNGDPGQTNQTVDLANGATLSLNPPTPGVIAGRVIFDSPRPTGELEILLGNGRTGRNTEVDSDGSFKIENAAAGELAITLSNNQLAITSITAKGSRIVNNKLEVASGAAIELTIHVQAAETLATVEGFAMQNEAGVPGAMVLLLPQDAAKTYLIRRDQSNSDGSFALTGVIAGRYTLVAIDDGQNLAYKLESVMQPYRGGGTAVTIPLKSTEPLKVTVQTRKR
jgi:hypothetical protein